MAEPNRQRMRDLIASMTTNLADLSAEVDLVLPPVSTNVVRVRPGDDLAAAIASLKDGGTILGQPGEYLMNYEPIERESRAFVTIQTDTSNLPQPGQRISLEYLPGMMTIRSKNGLDGAVQAQKKPHGGLAFVGVAFGPQVKDRTQVVLGGESRVLLLPEQRPRDFMFDRVVFAGHPINGQHRGIDANCLNLVVHGCSFHDIHEVGRDSQAICGWNGSENVDIDNCYLEAGAENILFGGSVSASGAMNPRNVRITNSHLSKSRAWMDLPVPPSIKTLFEIKNLEGLYMAGCLLDHNWRKDWASGVGMTIKVAPQGNAPWTTMKGIVIEDIVMRGVGKPLDVVGWNDGNTPTGSERASGITLTNWLVVDVNIAPWLGDNRGISFFTIPHEFKADHLTLAGPRWNAKNSFFMFDDITIDPTLPHRTQATGFRFTNSLVDHGSYGIFGSSMIGKSALDKQLTPDYQMTGNAIRKGSGTRTMPAGNPIIDGAAFDASFEADGYTLRDGSVVANVPTTDGQKPGADIARLRSKVRDQF